MATDHSVVPTVAALGSPPAGATPAVRADSERCAHDAIRTFDDRQLVAYVVATQPPFDELRQAAGQLAGLLVLAAAGARSITPEHAVLAAADSCHRAAATLLGQTIVPEPARPQHHELSLAAHFIGIALRRMSRDLENYGLGRANVYEALEPLQRGYRHVQRAAALLPGFEVVAFSQGCCATHPAVRRAEGTEQ